MAGSINFSGLGSTIDFGKLTEAILAERSRPLAKLQTKSADYTKRSDALKQLNTQLAILTEAVGALTKGDLGTGRQASSSASTIATSTATTTAATGTLSLTVTRLATNLTQASRVYAATSSAVLAGGATTATFELRKGGASTGTPITIDATNNSLAGLRDAINNAKAGVTATIVDVDVAGTQNKLVLTSTATGEAGRVQLVETTATGTAADLNLTSLNPPGATTDFSALDASLTINGLTITRSTNSISDAVSGVTLDLKGAGAANITVSASTSDLSEKISTFVKAYNDVQDFIAAQYTKDSQGRPTGPLAGDPTLRTVLEQLRSAVGASSTTNGGAFTNLTQIGTGRDGSGKLTLDSTVLNDKLANSPGDVQALLSGKTASQTGLAHSIYDTYSKLSDSLTGVVQTAIKGYQDSIKSLDKSIAARLARLDTLRDVLTRQFAAADAAISQLNGQSTALASLIKALEPRDSRR
jgi:flagellar hook-associated protein 2